MESKHFKSVIMCVLILILGLLVQGQIQVAEGKSCCRDTRSRNCYNVCLLVHPSTPCSKMCGCVLTRDSTCPREYPKLNLLPSSAEEPDAIEYCKLGCRLSVCDNVNSAELGEDTKVGVGRCGDACGRFCNDATNIASVDA
ncbi:putative leaf thionin [Triticum urartu]|uniref:Putative leaf thionin n=1 Tax=Triticum urartu TaxID=4572 RepID=M7YXV1_TRIUA|nr:putative leaf thionin [Triticum urartu]